MLSLNGIIWAKHRCTCIAQDSVFNILICRPVFSPVQHESSVTALCFIERGGFVKLIIAVDITADERQVETFYLIKAAESRTV